jgi:Ca2+-binding RTX toxin-like protein
MTGNAGANRLDGGDANDTLAGGDGADTLLGGLGNDSLNGGLGADSLMGGAGDDRYSVDNAADVLVEALNEGNDRVDSAVSWALGANFESLYLTGGEDLNGTGNALNNTLVGNTGNNILDAGDGNDRLTGGEGLDTLVGGIGNDTLTGGLGADLLTGGAGRDVFSFALLGESDPGNPDIIADFIRGTDKLSVSAIDPSAAAGDQAFVFIGAAGFGGAGVAEARVYNDGVNSFAAFDIGNGGAAEMLVRLNGVLALTASDFVL